MKLKAIKKVKRYKSFQDFTWQPFFNNERFHDDVNILYGENGSGKSSVCNILKSVSQNKNFDPRHKPEEVSLTFDDGEYKYLTDGNVWDKLKNEDDILFFDREFVDEHVHLGHNRDTQQGGQEQRSGKMIIEFDSEAIKLREAREKSKINKDEQEKIVEKFRKDNNDTLLFALLEGENVLYEKYKTKPKGDITKIKNELLTNKKMLEKKLETDHALQKQVDDIQDTIKEIEDVEIDIPLSDYGKYQAIFDFDLKEQVKIEAEQNLIEKLRLHKDFFEVGFEIREKHSDQCPFCQSKNEEENIGKIIKAYNDIFDNTYKKQLQQFSDKKRELVSELELIKQEFNDFDLNAIFLELKKLDQDYKIKKIYSVNEEKFYKKPQTNKISELITRLTKLNKPNKEKIKTVYDEVKAEAEAIEKFFEDIAKFVDEKNKIIQKFKADNTGEKIKGRIIENSAKISEIDRALIFFNEKKIDSQTRKEQKEKQLKSLEKKLEDFKTQHKNIRTEYENYASTEAFAKLLRKIESYFKNFNFNFQLTLDTERRTGTTKEFPFAFKVLDSEKNERDFKEGLSEGELQVLSLCFFFAFLDIQKDKENKVLVFDDPITSLDNSNLSSLVDLISIEREKFSQTFVFTHHRTFFKFLRNKFKDCSQEYNILRNLKEFGGSFICKSRPEQFVERLKNFDDHLKNIPPESLDIELKIVEYGQYLRYEVERFIKNNLLHWNANDFPTAIDGVKNNRSIDDDSLDRIKQVYSFCNWTTSHIDVGDDHGLQQLKDKIGDFIAVTNA